MKVFLVTYEEDYSFLIHGIYTNPIKAMNEALKDDHYMYEIELDKEIEEDIGVIE